MSPQRQRQLCRLVRFGDDFPRRRACRVTTDHGKVCSPLLTRNRVRIADMNWMQVEEYLRRDDRAVLPLGSTEQHSYLSLSVDSILAERLATEAAEPSG